MTIQAQYILSLAAKGLRSDGRKPDEFRKIEIEKNPIEKAEGSARVRIGKTDVIAGVKMEVGTPFPDRLDEGALMVSAELSPLASPYFEKGPPGENAIELARVVDRGIRESKAIDMKKLCIEEGEKVWMVCIDIQILNHDGNLIDASALAASVALLGAKIPEYDGKTVKYEKKTKKLPVLFKPVPVTIAKVAGNIFIDPSLDEEGAMGARLTITTKDNGNVCSLQKGGSEPLFIEDIEKALDLAVEKSKELRKMID
jgi:exosome complex component RRP42